MAKLPATTTPPLPARSRPSISIFPICSIAAMARLRLLAVGVGDQLIETPRDDLPRDAEAVVEPAARPVLAALAERAQ
jgi:hypothetical protein